MNVDDAIVVLERHQGRPPHRGAVHVDFHTGSVYIAGRPEGSILESQTSGFG
jgi:hypothetical protein